MNESRLWLLSVASTALILVLLALHFAIMHFSPAFLGQSIEEVRSYTAMIERGRDAAQMVVYVLFLGTALYHGLYGLRGIILELGFVQRWRRPITWLLVLVWLVVFAYGTYVTWWTFAVA